MHLTHLINNNLKTGFKMQQHHYGISHMKNKLSRNVATSNKSYAKPFLKWKKLIKTHTFGCRSKAKTLEVAVSLMNSLNHRSLTIIVINASLRLVLIQQKPVSR